MWTVGVTGASAAARPGPAARPALTVAMSLADFVRVAAGELDVARALLEGRVELDGPLALAERLGEMFGAPSVF